MTEEAILQGCLKNHAAAQKELYNRYSPKMLAVCYRFAHNREDAEDMLQEGFIKVFLQIHTFQSKGAFEGWIRRTIVQAKQIVDCIRLLPIGYRTVLNLYAIEGYAHKEIAGMLDIEESTSRSQYTRARQMLEDILIKKNILQKPREKAEYLVAVR